MLLPTRTGLFVCLLTLGSLQAATLPYLDNFNDDTVGSTTPSETAPESGAFSPSTASFSVVSGGISGQSYNLTEATNGTAFGSAVDFTGPLGGAAASAADFTISSQFRLNTGTAGSGTIGLGFLGTDNLFADGYFVDINFSSGVIRFVEDGTPVGPTFDLTNSSLVGVVFALTITGTYTDPDNNSVNDTLELTATVSGGLSGSIDLTDSTPQIGTLFGYRHRNSTSDVNVDMDDFSVVPEPASVALLALSACAFGAVRRRNPLVPEE